MNELHCPIVYIHGVCVACSCGHMIMYGIECTKNDIHSSPYNAQEGEHILSYFVRYCPSGTYSQQHYLLEMYKNSISRDINYEQNKSTDTLSDPRDAAFRIPHVVAYLCICGGAKTA